MAKITLWRIQTEDAEHIVTYSQNRLSGHVTVTLDGEEYSLSAGPLSLRAARREPFRIVGPDGDAEQAVLVVDKQGHPSLLFRSQEVPFEEKSTGVVVEVGFGKH